MCTRVCVLPRVRLKGANEIVSRIAYSVQIRPLCELLSKMSFRESFPIRRFRTVSCQLQPRLLLRCCCPLDFNGGNECCICGNGTREHALQDAPHTGCWRTDGRVLSSVDQPSLPRGTPSDQAFPGKVTCATADTPTHWHGYAVRFSYMFCR